MKMTIAAFAAVAALSVAASAQASTTYTLRADTFDGSSGNFGHSGLTKAFADQYDFANVDAGVYDITLSTASSGLSFTTMTFDGQSLPLLMTLGKTSFYGLTDVAVQAGTQSIDVAGTYVGSAKSTGSYDGTVAFTAAAVSAAPEPGVWALMLAGLAMVGATLRLGRRQRAVSVA